MMMISVLLISLLFDALAVTPLSKSAVAIQKMKDERDAIGKLESPNCEGTTTRSECFKKYLESIQVRSSAELVLLSVAATDMYARDRLEKSELEIPFRLQQIENWLTSIEKVDIGKFYVLTELPTSDKTQTEEKQNLDRAKSKILGKARDELKILYEILSKADDAESKKQKAKYRDLLTQYNKALEIKWTLPKQK